MTSLHQELANAIRAAEEMSARDPEFACRAEALAFLDTHVFDRLAALTIATIQPDLRTIDALGRSVARRLETSNQVIVSEMRTQIVSGKLSGQSLSQMLLQQAGSPKAESGYDALDLLVAQLLDASADAGTTDTSEPELRVKLTDEMVAYQPTPARAILDLVERASIAAGDVFCDLGSGLGWVVIFVALLTGARSCGIEIEPAYNDLAKRSARSLGANDVDLVEGDLLVSPLPDASVYFLYTPLRGATLQRLLERLRVVACARPLRICTLGPCTADVAKASWLTREDRAEILESEITVFHSVR